ncbi:uncharacterized protein HD556DRAFT_1302715 [Suillus plorans]|uniref:Uncharacterized protein n=1 Tax=Suillus plorans TaxID=116603 RepID=A0A9P7JA62_9AGAM|nr:uncharacterized protein HD556DRAFT_1302715 [Suillus plorans]KAG1810409.1 hypothetical protein HD556DRAFT_1302715 [Suillus plorans]
MYSQMYYEDHVKVDADAAIAAEEPEEIKTEVRRRHQEALDKWRQTRELNRAGLVEEADEETKKKYGLTYGGLKFTCIAGGRNPITGEVVVLDFHLGDTEEGADFSAHYPRFSEVQAVYATFLWEALSLTLSAYNNNVQALERDNEHDHCSGVDEAEGGNVESGEDELENDTYNVLEERDLSGEDWDSGNDTYTMSKECNPGPIPSLATPSELASQDFDSFWTTMPTLVTDVLGNTNHNIALQGVSASDFAEIDRLLAVMPQVDLNFFDNLQVPSFSSGPEYNNFTISESQSTAGSDYNFMFNDFSFTGSDFETSTPRSSPSPTCPVHELEEIPTSISSDFTLSCVTLPAAPPVQLPEQQPEGPCQTMRRHVPSTRKQALNAIGSSKSRVCLSGDVGKENSLSGTKRKAGAISGANNFTSQRMDCAQYPLAH